MKTLISIVAAGALLAACSDGGYKQSPTPSYAPVVRPPISYAPPSPPWVYAPDNATAAHTPVGTVAPAYNQPYAVPANALPPPAPPPMAAGCQAVGAGVVCDPAGARP
jgi:hypothetical protein